jgi:hypothetical protein
MTTRPPLLVFVSAFALALLHASCSAIGDVNVDCVQDFTLCSIITDSPAPSQQAACNYGTIVSACPSANLVGCCTIQVNYVMADTPETLEECYYLPYTVDDVTSLCSGKFSTSF